MRYYTYVLYSKRLNKYYAGSTQDVANRLSEHNSGEDKFTKTGMPWVLIRSFIFNTRSEAIELEYKIKRRGIKRFLKDT